MQSNTMSDKLCEELMVEIFTRLPPKTLLRFRSVSKSLRSLIDSPDFVRMHTSRSPQRFFMAHQVQASLVEEYGDAIFFTLHEEDQLPYCGYSGVIAVQLPRRLAAVIGTCNGVFLLFGCGNGIISLWNPSIMRQLTLPDCPCPQRYNYKYAVGFGLGFDPITDDHKVVSIPLHGNGNGESSFVYATKTGAWLPIASPMPLYSKVPSAACYLNGVLHWVVERFFTDSKSVEHRYILTLDLSTYVFGVIALPNPSWDTGEITTIQGSLTVVSTVLSDTWILVRRGVSWSAILKSTTIKAKSGFRKVMELGNNGDLLLDAFWDEFQVYSSETGTKSALVDFNDTTSIFDMDRYVETLHLLHTGIVCEVNHIFWQDKMATSFKRMSGNER